MTSMDLKQSDKALYNPPSKEPVIVEVPPMQYLMIDGQGDPNTVPAFTAAVQSLYTLSYGIRALSKAAGTVYTVMPLEGLWWFENDAPVEGDEHLNDQFIWTAMIRQPDHITPEMVEQARIAAAKKKPELPLDSVRFETYDEGLSAQIMHLGPYSAEKPTIMRLHAFVEDNGYSLRGKHHEIYLNDPAKVAPEKVRTVIRYPIA
jgi:hypothetical protein